MREKRRWFLVALAVLVMIPVGCGSSPTGVKASPSSGSSTTEVRTPTSEPSTTGLPPVSSTTTSTTVVTTAASVDGTALPVSSSAQLSSGQQDPSILQPTSCTEQNGIVTATGSFSGGFVPEVYRRFGDVVELYAYNSNDNPPTGADLQVLDLGSERPGSMSSAAWTASAPIDSAIGQPLRCLVAVQSTHAFMAAGNAGS
jgi:hypothetical protein